MARRRKGRDISGWLILDKPAGLTSSAVVNKARWAFDAKKAGHSGTLDPDATNNITYFALSWGSDDDARFDASMHHEYTTPTTLTDGCGGYILMSSNLVFYS